MRKKNNTKQEGVSGIGYAESGEANLLINGFGQDEEEPCGFQHRKIRDAGAD